MSKHAIYFFTKQRAIHSSIYGQTQNRVYLFIRYLNFIDYFAIPI